MADREQGRSGQRPPDGALLHDILVAEDSQNDRLILEEAFGQIQHSIRLHFVRDGEGVLHYLTGRKPDGSSDGTAFPSLLLLDLNMPCMNGNECLRALRADPVLQHLPVVVFSTSVKPGQIRQAYADGANAFLVKPGCFDQLVAKLETLRMFWFACAALPPRIAPPG